MTSPDLTSTSTERSTERQAAPAALPNSQSWLRLVSVIARNCFIIGGGLALMGFVISEGLRPLLAAVNVDEEVTSLLAQVIFGIIPGVLYLTIGFTVRQLRPKQPNLALATTVLGTTLVFGMLTVAVPSAQNANVRPSLEMTLAQTTDGILVEGVTPGSNAELAGVLPGDLITAIRREAIDLAELEKRVLASAADTPFRFRIQRNGEEIQLTVRTILTEEGDTELNVREWVSNWLGVFALGMIGLWIPLGWIPYLILGISLLPLLFGYTWLIVATFSQQTRGLLPVDEFGNLGGLTLANWDFLSANPVMANDSIWAYTLNSFVIAVTMTAILMVLCSMTAYALSRMEFSGRRLFLSLTLILHGFPAVTLLIPIFIVLLGLGKLPLIGQYIGFNTLGGIALVEVAFGLPFGVWLMKGFFDNISWDMERSALIDGASRWRTFWEVILPQIRPGLMALGTFTFVGGWNTYLIPATFSVGTKAANLPVYIQRLTGETNPINWNQIAAIGLFQLIPILILFFFAQEYLLNIYSGGTKGSS
jgi:inositol-phosphate transport system permease protein